MKRGRRKPDLLIHALDNLFEEKRPAGSVQNLRGRVIHVTPDSEGARDAAGSAFGEERLAIDDFDPVADVVAGPRADRLQFEEAAHFSLGSGEKSVGGNKGMIRLIAGRQAGDESSRFP